MTIPEEIEQLKIQLEQTSDRKEESEIIIKLLNKSLSIHNTDIEPVINRLFDLAEELKVPGYRAWALNYLAHLKRLQRKFDEARNISSQALKIFQKINDQIGLATSYHNIGNVYYMEDDYVQALKNYGIALDIRKQTDDKLPIATSCLTIGTAYLRLGNYVDALDSLLTALRLNEEIQYKPGIAQCYTHIGFTYDGIGKYEEAIKNHVASLKVKEEIGDRQGVAGSYNNIGTIYFLRGNYGPAYDNYMASLKISEEIDEKSNIAYTYNNIGLLYEKQGLYSEALQYHFASLALKKNLNDKYGIASSHESIASVYLSQKKFNEALDWYLLALKLSEELGNRELMQQSSLSISVIYKIMGNYENALNYYEKHHSLEKEMLGEESTKQLNKLSFMHNLEQKEKNLEIEQLRNVELKKERDRSENLLLNILPAEVAEELKEKGSASAKLFDEVTVLFTDFKGFTNVSERLTPQQLVDELHACFSAFDTIIAKYNIEKIKTVGDAYLAAAGLPSANPSHAEDLVSAAIEIREFMLFRKQETVNRKQETFEIRIGVHSGSVVAGIVGVKKFAYDIWGDTVNTAARMEQNSEAGKINISETTYQLVKDKFTCQYRGEIEAKNKGKLKMYFVEGSLM